MLELSEVLTYNGFIFSFKFLVCFFLSINVWLFRVMSCYMFTTFGSYLIPYRRPSCVWVCINVFCINNSWVKCLFCLYIHIAWRVQGLPELFVSDSHDLWGVCFCSSLRPAAHIAKHTPWAQQDLETTAFPHYMVTVSHNASVIWASDKIRWYILSLLNISWYHDILYLIPARTTCLWINLLSLN